LGDGPLFDRPHRLAGHAVKHVDEALLEGPICGALWIDGAPLSGGAGDLALLTLVVGVMLLHRRKRELMVIVSDR
jgi:hypothetical protein